MIAKLAYGMCYNPRESAGEVVMVHRVNVNFGDTTYAALEDLAESKDGNISLALRDAIALAKYVKDKRANGGKLLMEEGGDIQEIVPL